MKTYTELHDDLVTGDTGVTSDDELNGISLKTFGGAALFTKVRKLTKEIHGVKTGAADNVDEKIDKLFLKMNLLSKQNMVTSLLVTQLGLMDKKGNR